jgi:hypothetical protein
MGNPNQKIDESPVADADTPATADTTQSAIDAAVAAFAAEHGIEPPAATSTTTPTALQALAELADDAEHTSFGQKVLTLVDRGIGEADLVAESPAVKAIASIVGELAEKLA